MYYCTVCWAENPVEATSCGSCGADLVRRCPHCAALLSTGAGFCPVCGKPASLGAPAANGSPAQDTAVFSAGGRKLLTVLFAEVVELCGFSASRSPEVQKYLEALWARVEAIVAAHGGALEKRLGQSVMALFGSRQAREQDPAKAVRAALEIQTCFANLEPAGTPPGLQMRIGLHTGMVALGPSDPAGSRTLAGETVDLASRLRHIAPAGGVLISQDTYRHVYGLFDVRSLPPMAIEGQAEPVQLHLVLRARTHSLARTLRGVEGAETEMVGRVAELERLKSAFLTAAEKRQLQVITVLGEAGIGKSRLLHEFQKWVEVLPHKARFFCGRASAEMAGLPFSLMRDVFSARFEIKESDPASVAREKFEAGFVGLQAGGYLQTGRGEEVQANFIGQLLGFDFSASRVGGLPGDSDQIRHRAFQEFTRFFRAVSQDPPEPEGMGAGPGVGKQVRDEVPTDRELIPSVLTGHAGGMTAATRVALLVFEDLHWSDEGTLDLITHLAQKSRNCALMILALARPSLLERRPAWGEGWTASASLRLDLGPLSRHESDVLVQTILRKADHVPPTVRELILAGGQGNPFYLEEIIKMLIDKKVIVPEGEHWRIEPKRLGAAPIPPTLTGVLQARLDSLAPLERAVLQGASVVGHVFWDSAVERLSGLGDVPGAPPKAFGAGTPALKQDIREALAGLCRKELIYRRQSSAFAGAVEFSFKHELLRNVAYEGLLKKSRRNYHAQVAAWFIEHSGQRIAEFSGLVAAHFEQAGLMAEASEWYGRAGQHARAGYTPAAAIEYFQKAVCLSSGSPAQTAASQAKRLEWYEGLSESLATQGRFAEARESYATVGALAKAAGDVATQARAWNGAAFLYERQGDNRASVEAAEKAERLARGAGEASRGALIRALHLKGWAFYRLGDAPSVLAMGDQTLKLCTESGDRRGMATSFKLFGVAHLQLGQYPEADRYFQQGLALCQELGDRRNAAAMFSNLGESARLRGDHQTAAELYQKALAVAREIGERPSEMIYLSNLSGALLGLRRFNEAEAGLRQVIAQTAMPKSCSLSETHSFLAEACLGQGKLAEALEAAQQALTIAQASENHLDLGGAWRILGRVAVAILRRPQDKPHCQLPFPVRNERGEGWGEGHPTADAQASHKKNDPPLPSPLLLRREERENSSALSSVVQAAASTVTCSEGNAPRGISKPSSGSHPEFRMPHTPDPAVCFAESLKVFERIGAEGEQSSTLMAWADFEREQGCAGQSRKKTDEAQNIRQQLGKLVAGAGFDPALQQGCDHRPDGDSRPVAR